jgi:pyruvate,water dikinase
MTATTAMFEAPGPGQWALDRSHFPGGATPITQWLLTGSMGAGMERVFAEIGVPAKRIECRFVNGFMYTRLTPLIGGDRPPRRLPPTPILKLATRIHPAFRSRTKRAAAALTDRRFLNVARDWETNIRPDLHRRNREFQEFDVGNATDEALAHHIGELLDQLAENLELHFYLHGHDLGPIARYLHASIGWGIQPTAATGALAGASPSTARPLTRLVELRRLVETSGRDVRTLDDVRAISPDAATLLDEHLDEHGHVLATGYDITAFTLVELPGAVLAGIRSAVAPDDGDARELADSLRALVPATAHAEFDGLLADARAVMDMRDDNGPQTTQWPTGLLRRALLEAGRRLVARGQLHEPEHALELTPSEARGLFGANPVDADAIATRLSDRLEQQRLEPPQLLGPDEPEPPLDAMPKPLADLVATVQTALEHLGMDGATRSDPLVGVGIGAQAYTGRVRTAETADEAIEKLEPGDILVVRATSPAFNAVLSIAGAVVTANGGALSHAAVLARELGIPAVVGVGGALDLADGSTITVDPVAGRVVVS